MKGMRKSILIIPIALLILVALASGIQAGETPLTEPIQEPGKEPKMETTYTNTTKTTCDENKRCTLTLYSGITHVEEEGRWIPMQEAKSLKPYFNTVYLSRAADLTINIKDFNYNHIEFDLLVSSKQVGKQIPITMYHEEETTKKDGELEKTIIKSYDENKYFASILNKHTVSTNYTWGDTIKFGKDSTILVLQDAGTENLEDDANDSTYSSTTLWLDDEDYPPDVVAWIKFNISLIPIGATITDANLSVFVKSDEYSSSDIIQVYSNVNETWTLEATYTTTGMNFATTGTWQSSVTNPLDETWIKFDVTPDLQLAYAAGDKNTTYGFKVKPDVDISDEYGSIASKENAVVSIRPMLTITYETGEPPAYTCTTSCPASGWWEITNGERCTLANTCILSGGSLDLNYGVLTITSTGNLVTPPGYEPMIKSGSWLEIENGGKMG